MMISYGINQPLNQNELEQLYASVGWTAYTDQAQDLVPMIENSLCYFSAWDGDRLVGLVRAVGDGYVIGYVQDILIDPDYQRQGIGSHLLQLMFDQLKPARQIILMTDDQPETQAFYSSMGMKDIATLGCKVYALI